MLKLKVQYFGHLFRRADSSEKTLMLGKIEGKRRRGGRGWNGWMASLSQWTWVWANSRRCEGQEAWSAAVHGVPKSWTQLSDWTRTDSQTKLTREGISLLKNCSTSLIIREVQMKTTMKFHLTLVRIVIIKEIEYDKWWHREIGTLVHCWWECKALQLL